MCSLWKDAACAPATSFNVPPTLALQLNEKEWISPFLISSTSSTEGLKEKEPLARTWLSEVTRLPSAS